MPLYSYRAVTAAGDVSSGELEAANESEIVDRLRDRGLLPMQIAQSLGGGVAGERRPSAAAKCLRGEPGHPRQRALITRELATLLRAGLTLDRALELLISLATSLPVAVMLQGIRDEVRGGKSLSQALDARRDVSRASTSTSSARVRRAARSVPFSRG